MGGKTLLYAELFFIIALLFFGKFSLIFTDTFLTILFIIGTILIVWSVRTMRIRYFSPFPEPPKKHKLAQSGLYQYMLHPIYTGIILIALALLFSNTNLITVTIFILLFYVLDKKASLEERLLTKMYPEYKAYKSKTKKFIPLVY